MKGEAKNSITDSQMDDVEVIYTIGESLISMSPIFHGLCWKGSEHELRLNC